MFPLIGDADVTDADFPPIYALIIGVGVVGGLFCAINSAICGRDALGLVIGYRYKYL
jgi:hypothetical protein